MQYRLKYVFGAVGILIFGVILLLRSQKAKSELTHITGRVVYYRKSLPGHFDRNDADSTMRYLRINTFPQAFVLGVNKGGTDSTKASNRLDHLKIGDTLTIYLASPLPFQKHSDTITNYDVQFVERNHIPYFVRGNGDRIGAYFFLAVGGLLLIVLLAVKFKH